MIPRSPRRHVARALMSGTLAIASLLIGVDRAPNGDAPSAFAAQPRCADQPNNTNCTGFDPSQGGCNGDAYTAYSRPIYRSGTGTVIGVVELRWSPRCKS